MKNVNKHLPLFHSSWELKWMRMCTGLGVSFDWAQMSWVLQFRSKRGSPLAGSSPWTCRQHQHWTFKAPVSDLWLVWACSITNFFLKVYMYHTWRLQVRTQLFHIANQTKWQENHVGKESALLSRYPHHLNTKCGWVHGRVVCIAFPGVFPPLGMKCSLVDQNKLFRTFLSQSEKALFKQAANEAIRHLVWCCACS